MGLTTPDIARLKKGNKTEELAKCLDHPKASVRYNAFVALTSNARLTDEIKSRMKRLMYVDPDPWVKTIATLRFAKLGDPEISENLIQIIQEGSQKDKLMLLRIITDYGISGDVTVLQIIKTGLADEDVLVRLQAITAANASKNIQLMPDLGRMLTEKYSKVRLLAAKALYNLGKYESAEYIISLLTDKNIQVHSAARIYISSIISDRDFYSNNYEPSELYPGFIRDTELFPGNKPRKKADDVIKEALDMLHEACNDRFRHVRVEVLKSIAVFRNTSSIDFVEKLLHDKFPEVRLEALNTLEKIGGKRSLEIIESLPRDKKKIVREAIDRVLTRMRRAQ